MQRGRTKGRAGRQRGGARRGRSGRRGAGSHETPTTTNTARTRPTSAEGQWIGTASSVALTERNLDVRCVIAILMTGGYPRRRVSSPRASSEARGRCAPGGDTGAVSPPSGGTGGGVRPA